MHVRRKSIGLQDESIDAPRFVCGQPEAPLVWSRDNSLPTKCFQASLLFTNSSHGRQFRKFIVPDTPRKPVRAFRCTGQNHGKTSLCLFAAAKRNNMRTFDNFFPEDDGEAQLQPSRSYSRYSGQPSRFVSNRGSDLKLHSVLAVRFRRKPSNPNKMYGGDRETREGRRPRYCKLLSTKSCHGFYFSVLCLVVACFRVCCGV